MLTDEENVWLKCRDKSYGHYCMWCDLWCDERGSNTACPIRDRKEKFADAAEFEARVTAKLATMMYQLAANSLSRDFSCEKSCVAHLVCQKDKSCVHAFLKYARIAVEEEMDV